MPDISVLIPARNAAATIERAIRSALEQASLIARLEVEVIVCYDGSADDTAKVVRGINDPRVVSVSGNTNGVGAALNLCAASAMGDYFIELDADDWMEPGCLSRMIDALDGTPSHVGFAHGCVQYHGDSEQLYIPRQYTREDFLRGNATLYPFLYKRAAWDAGCRYADHFLTPVGRWISVQDWDMALQLVWHMRYTGVALPDVLVLHYDFKRGAEGQSLGRIYNRELTAAFKQRWTRVSVERIG